jgi:CBS-domain-containing membrane protein
MRLWTVNDVMTTDVATVSEETPFRRIVDILADRRVAAVPVVDEAGRVLGVVSETDLLYKMEIGVGPHARHPIESHHDRAVRRKAGALVARDLMTRSAVTTTRHTPIAAAARLMDARSVRRLVVVTDFGQLVGIVTRSDLLKVHLRPDEDIRRDVVEGVLHRVLAVHDGVIRVETSAGVVTLQGCVPERSHAVTAVHLAQAVAGVVAVNDEITYERDDTVPVRAVIGAS